MAYINKEQKSKIAAALKGIMPKNWKYSLRLENHSQITMTIQSAPVDLVAMLVKRSEYGQSGHIQLSHCNIEQTFTDPAVTEIMVKARNALNLDNFDNSDSMSDYYSVGHYIAMHLGKWDKPFTVNTK